LDARAHAARAGRGQRARQSGSRDSRDIVDRVPLESDQPEIHGDAVRSVLIAVRPAGQDTRGLLGSRCRSDWLSIVLHVHRISEPAGADTVVFSEAPGSRGAAAASGRARAWSELACPPDMTSMSSESAAV